MNLLVTNAHEFQAYLIAFSLRAEADRIVITEGGESVVTTGFRGMLPYSRFVDSSYRVPYFADDWLAGRLQSANTTAEEAYIRRIEEICEREQIDTIFPSLDPEIYLFAKNKARLQHRGVLAVVPEPDVLRVPMDKALTLQAAARVGFPCVPTFYPEHERDVERILEESAPPWIVKPRFTAHGVRLAFVAERSELRQTLERTAQSGPWPIVQEYIPGGRLRMYNVLVGHDSEILTLLSPECIRSFAVGYRVSHRTTISASTGPFLLELRALIREMRLWGPYTIQTKVDPRDGVPKLLEINARFGNNLWRRTELGVNEPLIALRLAQGRTPDSNLVFREGVIQLEPINDLLYLAHQLAASIHGLARSLLGRRQDPVAGADINPRGVLATLRAYAPDYFNRRPKVYKSDSSNLLVDPWPCLRFLGHSIGREVKIRLGRSRGVARQAVPSSP